jgi:FkbM family methyltransferase
MSPQACLTAAASPRIQRLPAIMPSQNGEDVLIHKFFGGRRTGLYVEVGAYHGVGFSNTYFLDALGWEGILVEPAPDQAEACRRSRPHSRVVQAACGRGGGRTRFKVVKGGAGIGTLSYMGHDLEHERRIAREGGTIEEIEVPLLTLDEIVGDRIGKIDLLSIDVEGAELQVLESGNLTALSPELIVLEDNTGGVDRRERICWSRPVTARISSGPIMFSSSRRPILAMSDGEQRAKGAP